MSVAEANYGAKKIICKEKREKKVKKKIKDRGNCTLPTCGLARFNSVYP